MRLSGDSDAVDVGVICGPTAAGKSALARRIAAHTPVTIIAADSRQIYRSFDIGTAKPDAAERERVPHRGIDIADPGERYSAAAWAAAADGWIDEARAARRLPLIVGGTGLYLRALFTGLFAEPPLHGERRESLARALGALDLAELRRWATRLDPARAHLGRTQLLRAIEVALLTGQRLSDLHAAPRGDRRWTPRYLVVDPGPDLLDRITSRTDDMLEHGWPEEVARLMDTVPGASPAWNATGYDAVRRMVLGEATPSDTREAVVIRTRQYAKRQRTWFRHQLPMDRVTRVNPSDGQATDAVVATWMSLLITSKE